jgi:hypothetical protein
MLARAKMGGYARGRFQLDAMALAIIERKRVALIAIASGDAKAGGGVESAAQETDGFRRHDSEATSNVDMNVDTAR